MRSRTRPVDPHDDRAWNVFSRYPPITWDQDSLWRHYAAAACLDLAEDLANGVWPMPENAAEEMALWLIVEDAELRVQHMYDLMPDQIDGLPEHPDDHTWDDCRDYLFHDHDILFLFNENLAGVEDPDNPMNDIVPDIADYRPKSWFDPFWGGEHRHPERPTYEQAVAQRRKDSP